uniref:Protein FAR1-RELATED SEQUENCE n=1 Tax=Cannabis sativa TaxID=3483 RepID=A0A803QPV4_CANSA
MADEENNLRSSQNEVEVIKIPEHEVENNGYRAHVQEANDEDVEETKDEEGHVNEELAQPDIAQWTILLQFLGIDKEPEDIEFSDFNGKEFLSIEQAEYYKVEEWEHNWMELLEKYDLANNKWIKDQYKSRGKWADTYLRGHYFGGARATGRCVIIPHPEVIENSRYISVTSQTCITSYLASRSQEAFEKAMSVISNLNAELEKIPPDKEFNILNKNEGEFPNNILDSKILKTRGRPTIASSSRSSPQGKDKNKRKSDDRHCAICSGTDHDKRNCPTKPKLTTDSPTQPKLPSKKNDQAKKKMKVNM